MYRLRQGSLRNHGKMRLFMWVKGVGGRAHLLSTADPQSSRTGSFFEGSESNMLMKYRLFTPGPTSVPEATLLELAKPVHHHRTAEFRAMFNEVQSLLQYVFQTKN